MPTVTDPPSARPVRLHAHNGDYSISFMVEFDGPYPELEAFAYLHAARRRGFWLSEWWDMEPIAICCPDTGEFLRWGSREAVEQPHLITHEHHPNLYAYFYPTCHHGMSLDLCMDPVGQHHYGTLAQELNGF